ncbi:MAG: serine/threonine-protein kinase [Candidatus Hydrogenedentota bacterium]
MPDDKTVVNGPDEQATVITDATVVQPTGPRKLGRYEIVCELGKGAMGVVYEGRDPNIGRRVAIKTARADVLQASGRAEELMKRFLREAQSAGGLNHPNIITIYDAGEQDGMAYIAMEYLEGGDLDDLLQKKQFLSSEETVRICSAVCEALDAAHKQGVVHRDIKPANVVMLKDGTVKVADFGIARMSDSSLTQEGSLIGTPHYMSPEQFQGRQVDGRSDLWSAAVMCYQMLTHQKPFTGETLSNVMTAVLKSTPLPPHEIDVTVNPTLSAVIIKALSKAPAQRYQTGAEMAAALRESINPKPDSAITGVQMLPGTVISPVAPEAVATTIADGASTVAREAGVGVSKEKGKTIPVKLIAGIVVLIGAGIAAYFVIGRETTGDVPPAGGDAAYSLAKVTVHICDSQEEYEKWSGGETAEDLKGFPTAPSGVEVTLTTADADQASVGQGRTNDEGLASISISPPLVAFGYSISKEGYKFQPRTVRLSPGIPNDTFETHVLLLANGIEV